MALDLKRIFIRAGRICAGLLLAVLGFIILGLTPSVSETPFAALTLGSLAGCALGWGAAVLVWFWAWLAAFGAGPA